MRHSSPSPGPPMPRSWALPGIAYQLLSAVAAWLPAGALQTGLTKLWTMLAMPVGSSVVGSKSSPLIRLARLSTWFIARLFPASLASFFTVTLSIAFEICFVDSSIIFSVPDFNAALSEAAAAVPAPTVPTVEAIVAATLRTPTTWSVIDMAQAISLVAQPAPHSTGYLPPQLPQHTGPAPS